MKRCAVVIIVALLCGLPPAVLSQEVISGEKFNAFRASSAKYMNLPVVLEDTFENIVQSFNKIEIGNNLSSEMSVKFKLGQCPYPCIGTRTPPVMDNLEKVGPGDLVRVTGSLRTIEEKKKKRVRVSGRYTGGPSYRERIHVYGPRPSEIYFNVSKVEKGWGKGDSPEEMLKEGQNLEEEHYKEVSIAEIMDDPDKLIDKAIWFEDTYGGVVENLTELEVAAGATSDNVIKFKMKDQKDTACYIPFSKSNLEGLKSLPAGTEVQIYGRIRVKETPKGLIGGIMADRILKIVTREETQPSAPEAAPAKGDAGALSGAAEDAAVLPPPAP
ncbi:MAG: hypothetical protein P9M00_06940 [Candidatus Tritonobacter lacicola]|nr:hypothetical protein [Candidatus Tritonobacter lacicola]